MYDCLLGYRFVMPSTVTIPAPDSTNSSFDQCNLMDGVYQCSYHPLFDCDPNVTHFYTNVFQRITTRFQTPIHMVNVLTSAPSSAVLWIQINPNSVEDNDTNFIAASIGGYQNFTRSFSSNVVNVNISIFIFTTSRVIASIIFCANQG